MPRRARRSPRTSNRSAKSLPNATEAGRQRAAAVVVHPKTLIGDAAPKKKGADDVQDVFWLGSF